MTKVVPDKKMKGSPLSGISSGSQSPNSKSSIGVHSLA